MNKAIAIAFLTGIAGWIISMQFWAFFTAPWIRKQGYNTADWKVWWFGFPETWDMWTAVRIALREDRKLPILLKWHLAFQFLQFAGFFTGIALAILTH